MALISGGAAEGEAEEQAQGAAVAPQPGPTALGLSRAQGSKPSHEAPAMLVVGAGGQVGLPLYEVSTGFAAALGLTVPRGPVGGRMVRLLEWRLDLIGEGTSGSLWFAQPGMLAQAFEAHSVEPFW